MAKNEAYLRRGVGTFAVGARQSITVCADAELGSAGGCSQGDIYAFIEEVGPYCCDESEGVGSLNMRCASADSGWGHSTRLDGCFLPRGAGPSVIALFTPTRAGEF